MQMIIEVRFVDDLGEVAPVRMAVIERELTTDPIGLSLAEGKALLASAQQCLVRAQCEGIADAHSFCDACTRSAGPTALSRCAPSCSQASGSTARHWRAAHRTSAPCSVCIWTRAHAVTARAFPFFDRSIRGGLVALGEPRRSA